MTQTTLIPSSGVAQFPKLSPAKMHQVFVVLSVHLSNPNGDPDGANRPRTNPYNEHGIISNASVKRKIRDYVSDKKGDAEGFDLMIRHNDVIATTVYGALRKAGISVSEPTPFSDEERAALLDLADLPEAFIVSDTGISYDQSLNARTLTKLWADLSERGVEADLIAKLKAVAAVKGEKADRAEVRSKATGVMIKDFYDARMFGYTAPDSAGKLKGPVQITDFESVAPVNIIELAVTRVARGQTSEKDGNSNFGRKEVVDHAVYLGTVHVSPTLAAQNGVTEEDLTLMLEGLYYGQALARSSSRPDVRVEALVVMTHESKYGNMPLHLLEERLKIEHDGLHKVNVTFDASELNNVAVIVVR